MRARVRHDAGMGVQVDGLTKVFTSGRGKARHDVVAVRAISFVVEAGERVAYIGPNGAGKSTSIKILTGVLHPTSGQATVLGRRAVARPASPGGRIGTLFGQRSVAVERAHAPPVVPDAGRGLRARPRPGAQPRGRAGRAVRRRRPLRRAGAQPLARSADALRAGRLHAPRARGAVPRRAHHRPRPAGQAALPLAAGAAQHRARHHDLPDVPRRRRHRARGPPGHRGEPR